MSPFLALFMWQGVMKRIALDAWGAKPTDNKTQEKTQ